MKKLFKRRHQSDEMALQITSMADIFIIILVFLIKSFSSSALNLAPSKGLLLPEAQASEQNLEALKVEVSEEGVQVEGQAVTALNHFQFSGGDLQKDGSSASLSKALDRERQRQLLIAKANSDVKVDAKILVISDQRAPYSTVKAVLASAALHGYTDFKLAVVKGN